MATKKSTVKKTAKKIKAQDSLRPFWNSFFMTLEGAAIYHDFFDNEHKTMKIIAAAIASAPWPYPRLDEIMKGFNEAFRRLAEKLSLERIRGNWSTDQEKTQIFRDFWHAESEKYKDARLADDPNAKRCRFCGQTEGNCFTDIIIEVPCHFVGPDLCSGCEAAEKAGAFDSQECRVCGCTNQDCSGCIERTGEACYWVEHDLCSACDAAEKARKSPPREDAVEEHRHPCDSGKEA